MACSIPVMCNGKLKSDTRAMWIDNVGDVKGYRIFVHPNNYRFSLQITLSDRISLERAEQEHQSAEYCIDLFLLVQHARSLL